MVWAREACPVPEGDKYMASSHLFASITFSKEGAPHQNFFVGRSEGGGAVFFISKNLPLKGKFFEMVSWGDLGGRSPPQESLLPVPCPRSDHALPPCLAPNLRVRSQIFSEIFRPIFFGIFSSNFFWEFFRRNFFRTSVFRYFFYKNARR